MEEMTINNTPTEKKLDKTGKIILITSLVLSLIFFIIGFVNLSTINLELSESRYISTEPDEDITVKFKAPYDDVLYICLEDAYLEGVSNTSAEELYSSGYTEYDHVYKVYMNNGSHRIKIRSTGYGVKIIIKLNKPSGYN